MSISPVNIRWLYLLFWSAGILLLLGGAYLYFLPPVASELIAVVRELEVTDGYSYQRRDVVFHLENRRRSPIPVLGC